MHRDLKPIVCLCIYDRKQTCEKWLRAWNNADKGDIPLVVIHNYDVRTVSEPGKPIRSVPNIKQVQRILSWHPDFYVPRVNRGGDMGAFQEFLGLRDEFPWWNVVFWFADDCLPMRRDFLHPFLQKMSETNNGLVGAFYEPVPVPHIRTCAFAVKREVALRFIFQESAHAFEHGYNNMYRQVAEMGYRTELAYGTGAPWCADQSLIWDVDHCFNHNLWDKYEEQFSGQHNALQENND